MIKRRIGRSGLTVAPLALGTNVFGWTIDEQTSFTILDGFVAAGCNLLDTADVYSRWAPGNQGGESEMIIGNWLQKTGNRDKVVIATKVGGDMGQGQKDITKDYILKEVEASLKRLKTDYIDLYQTHWDVDTTAVEQTLEAYDQLVKTGKVRVIGASNFTVPRFIQSQDASKKKGFPRYESYQPHYNLYDREEFERQWESLLLQEEVGVISYFSLAAGFLTGKYRSEADLSKSVRGEGNRKYLNPKGFRILAALDEVAKKHSSQPATVALAWLISRPVVTAPIASATSLPQLDSLTDAVNLNLDADDIDLLDQASAY